MSKRKPKRSSAAPPPKATPAPQPISHPRNLLIWIGAAVLIVLIGGGVWWVRSRPQPVTAPAATATPAAPAVILTPRPELATGAVDNCRMLPKFVKTVGLPEQVISSTSERRIMGLVMYDPANPPTAENPRNGIYQHPTWTQAGYLGHVVTDENGDIYTFPAPRVSLVDNPPDQQNIIYKVDTTTGKMAKWLELPAAALSSPENPFGVLGLAYDCETRLLYAASVTGSTRAGENGRIYRIDVQQAQVISQLDHIDAFGLGIFNGSTGKRLYFGAARQPEIRSIALDAAGDFVDAPRVDLSLAGLGQNNMTVRAIEFNFNLVASSEQMQNEYRFSYDPTQDTWHAIAPPAQ
jgi:hypothetical protein